MASIQGYWSLAIRDMEKDIIPMCRANGMSIGTSLQPSFTVASLTIDRRVVPYGVLGQGKFKSPEELKERAKNLRGDVQPSEMQLQVGKVMQDVAEEIGGGVTLIASRFP